MTSGPLYLYGLVRAGAVPSLAGYRGVASAGAYVLEHGALGAVVTPVPALPYDARREDLVAHSDVLQGLAEAGDVLPAGFGTVFSSAEELTHAFLERHHDALVHMLDRVHGAVEMQVRVTYVEEEIAREIASSDRKVQKVQARARSRGDIESKIELGRRFAEALERNRYADGRAVVDALATCARDVSVGEPPGEYGVVNASFLVDRHEIARFDAAAEGAAQSFGARASVRCIGPLSPYSFVDAGALTVS